MFPFNAVAVKYNYWNYLDSITEVKERNPDQKKEDILSFFQFF